ncbi:hypothetical protein [Desulfosporosinus burensis]
MSKMLVILLAVSLIWIAISKLNWTPSVCQSVLPTLIQEGAVFEKYLEIENIAQARPEGMREKYA